MLQQPISRVPLADVGETPYQADASAALGRPCIEQDEVTMLQGRHTIHSLVAAEAAEHAASASDVLAQVRHLVDALEEKTLDAGNVTLAAQNVTRVVEQELIPGIQASMAEMDINLATRRAVVKQCDVSLEAGSKSLEASQQTFHKSRSAHTSCLAAENGMAEQLADCLQRDAAAVDECTLLDALRSAKGAECDGMRAELDAAACDHATHAGGVCKSYGDCRTSALAEYTETAHSVEKEVRDRRAQMLEAKQAQCIAQRLEASAGEVEDVLMQVAACETRRPRSPSSDGEASLPPALECREAAVYPCVDGFLELEVGSDTKTWSAPCSVCPAMVRASMPKTAEKASAEAASAEAVAEALQRHFAWSASLLASSAEASAAASATAFRSLRAWVTSLLSSAKEYAATRMAPCHWSDASLSVMSPRHRAAGTLSVLGVGAKTSAAESSGPAAHAADQSLGQYVLILMAIPVVALGGALFVTLVLSSPRQPPSSRPSDMPISRRGSGSNLLAHRGVKDSVSPSLSLSAQDGKSPLGTISERPSMLSNPHGPHVGSSRPSLLPVGDSPFSPSRQSSHGHGLAGLCPELTIPDGSECILGIPSIAGAAPGEVMLKNVCDNGGQPLLYVGLTGAPNGGECILLATKTKQELAFTETGAAVRDEGWAGKIFRWDGELYARFKEANQDVGPHGQPPGTSPQSTPGTHKCYIIVSASEPTWVLWLTGNFRERRLTVEDKNRQVVAVVSPGEDLSFSRRASNFYRLRLGPHADSCTVIVALMAIERLLGQQGELGPQAVQPAAVPRVSSRQAAAGPGEYRL